MLDYQAIRKSDTATRLLNVFTFEYNNDSNKSSTNTSNDSYVSLVSEIKQGLSEISDDIESDISEVKENSSEMSDNAQTSITKEKYLSQVKESIGGAVGSNEEIKDVVLEDKVLTIFVDISQANVNAPIEFPLEEIAVSRASSITDEILGMDTILEYRNIEQTCSSVGFYNSLIVQHQI